MIPRKYLERLRMELAGTLLQAGDPGYDQSLVIDNGRIDLRPGVVVMCANPQDVATRCTATVITVLDAAGAGGNSRRSWSYSASCGATTSPRPCTRRILGGPVNAHHMKTIRPFSLRCAMVSLPLPT